MPVRLTNNSLFTLLSSLRYRAPARVATTVAGTLATSFENGDTVDGVVLATGDRILIKDQAAGTENGVYIVQASGAPVRASDADTGSELVSYTLVITEGTVNHDTEWTCINDTITIGVTNISFVFIGGGSVVVGPASSTDNALVRFDGTTGKTLQNSTVILDDTGILTGGIWQGTPVAVLYGGTGAATAAGARTNLGLGTIATQDANNVNITGGAITGGAISGATTITVQDNSLSIVDNLDNTKIVKLHAENVTTGTTRDWYFPDSTDSFVGINTPQSLALKILASCTIGNSNQVTLLDTLFTLQDNLDSTKQVVFQLSGITSATTRTYTAPDASGTLALTSDLHSAVTLAGENYLSLSGQQITAAAVNLSGTNVTGTLAAARFPALTGDVTTSAGSLATTIANSAVTLAKMANITTASILGRNTAGTGVVEVLSASTVKNILALNNVENTALSTWAGSTALTTTGTVTTGTWQSTVNVTGHFAFNNTTKTADYTMTASDGWVAVTNTLAPRTITLPTATSVPAGTVVFVSDETGSASSNNITISRQSTDLIGLATTTVTSVTISTNYGVKGFKSNGNNRWFLFTNEFGATEAKTLPTPSGAGRVIYDTGSAYSSIAAGTTLQELRGGGAAAPVYGTAGGCVLSFRLNTAGSWTANGYLGIADDGSSTLAANIVPWVAPTAGTLSNLRVGALANAPSTLHILIYKASNATSPSYSATALDATVTNATNNGNDTTHTVSVAAGDMIVAFSNTTWNTNGISVTCMFVPT